MSQGGLQGIKDAYIQRLQKVRGIRRKKSEYYCEVGVVGGGIRMDESAM